MRKAIEKLQNYKAKSKEEEFAVNLLTKKINQTNDSIEACISKAADEFAQIMYSYDPDTLWIMTRATLEFYNDILGAENEN